MRFRICGRKSMPTCMRSTWQESAMSTSSTSTTGTEREPLTPQQRLALSRRALMVQLQGEHQYPDEMDVGAVPQLSHSDDESRGQPFSWAAVAGNVVRR